MQSKTRPRANPFKQPLNKPVSLAESEPLTLRYSSHVDNSELAAIVKWQVTEQTIDDFGSFPDVYAPIRIPVNNTNKSMRRHT
jgi:hypothetical protein